MSEDSLSQPRADLLDYAQLRPWLSPRARDAHKGDFGHVLVMGSDLGMGGAALMAAEAAARTGAGLVSLLTRACHLDAALQRRPELMAQAFDDSPDAAIPSSLAERCTVLVLGPGLGQSPWSQQLLHAALTLHARRHLPLVIDADALNLLAKMADAAPSLDAHILTPHPGEAARLLNISSQQVQSNREAAACALQARYGGVVILKGQGSLLCSRVGNRQRLLRCQHGNPGMATGGMGDVLSGILGALLAQGFSPWQAAQLGTCVHALAADQEAAHQGERGMLATDLFPGVRRLMNPEPAP